MKIGTLCRTVLGLSCVLVVASLAACEDGTAETFATSTETTTVSAETTEYDADTLQIDTHIPCAACGSQGVAVCLHFPKSVADARYSDTGAPVVVSIAGGGARESVVGGETKSRWYLPTGAGMVGVYFNLPGYGSAPYDSGGTYDQDGPATQEALCDVLLFALGKKADVEGNLITDLVAYADVDNVGVVGFSGGGTLASVTMDRYSSELDGLCYYVGWENPASDEIGRRDLGNWEGINPAYEQGATVLDPVAGSVSTLDPSMLAYDIPTDTPYFDVNGNGALDTDVDFVCSYSELDGIRYFSTEIAGMLVDKGLVELPTAKVGDLASTEAFWADRDMSRHTSAVVDAIDSLQGAIVVGTQEDHMQTALGHPNIVVNYWGWSGLPFARINPDEVYVEAVLAVAGVERLPGTLADNPANAKVDFFNIDSMLEPEDLFEDDLNDGLYDLAAVVELADRVHYGVWTPDLEAVLQ